MFAKLKDGSALCLADYKDIKQGAVVPKSNELFAQVQENVDLNGWGTIPQDHGIDALRQEALSEALQLFNTACDAITQDAPSKEIDSWKKQEDEARAWLADNTAPTPLIDGLLTSRGLGETKAQLVQKIIDNADLWAVAYSAELGVYQSRVKRINATTATIVDIEAVITEMEPVA